MEVHTVVHLVVGLAMLAASICSASLTCLAKEEEQGVVWAPQQGLAQFSPRYSCILLPGSWVSGGRPPGVVVDQGQNPPSYNAATNIQHKP